MKINKLILIAALAAMFSGLALTAQNNSMTPYSRYGYGILGDNATSSQRGMGGVGYAMNSGRQINVMNPASYAAIDTLTFLFDIGANVKQMWTTDNGESGKNFGGGLDYITMQFPLGKYMGGSVGLLPFSEVGYSFGDKIDNGTNSRQGSGGINQAYVGVSGRPFKGFTVGANVSYLFGNILNDTYAYTNTGSQSLFERVMIVRDWNVRFGMQYSFNIKQQHRFTIGAVFSPGKSFRGHTYGVYYAQQSGDNTYSADTVGYTSLKGKYSMPATWGGGINYEWNGRLMAEVDFTYQPWKDAKYSPLEGFESIRLDNRWKVAAGIQYTPQPRGRYLQRIQYRVGGFYNHDYLMVGDNTISDYGVSVGFGLPAAITPMLRTVINLSVEYRHRQANPMPLIKEDYLTITLGVNFNELWFWQNKIK